MIEVPVYVPARRPDEATRDGRMGEYMVATIAPGSAIVGTDEDPEPGLLPEMIVVYYEGNLYGAVNMVTFADRAMFAYYRLRDHYPTTAMMAVPRNQVTQTATLFPQYGRVEVYNSEQQVRLCHWLGIEVGDGDALARQLRCDGVRVGAGQ